MANNWRAETLKHNKPVDRAHEFTAEEFAAKMRELEVITGVFQTFAETLAKTPTKTLSMHNAKSLDRGLTALNSAAMAMQKSVWKFQHGEPLQSGELKPRSPAAKGRTHARVAEPKRKFKDK